MSIKEHEKPFWAILATIIILTQPYHPSGLIVIVDCIMLVKTAAKNFSWQFLVAKKLEHGDWIAYITERGGVKPLACRFRDLKNKDFISTCNTSIPGKPRSPKYRGLVNWSQTADQCLQGAAAIDIHNDNWSGSAALEDVWHTKTPRWRKLAGILGFWFTNGFLDMKYFTEKISSIPPSICRWDNFKLAASQALANNQTMNLCKTRQLEKLSITEEALHMMVKLSNSRNCYYCLHGYSTPQTNRKSIAFDCVQYDDPLCRPSKGHC